MSRSYQGVILDAVELQIKTISVAASDGTRAIPQFERNPLTAMTAQVFPLVTLFAVEEQYEPIEQSGASVIYAKSMTGQIVYLFESIDPRKDAELVIHDVERALSDWTLGGKVDTFDLTANRLGVAENGRCEVSFEFEAKYSIKRELPGERI
jgi:hypothetical protein